MIARRLAGIVIVLLVAWLPHPAAAASEATVSRTAPYDGGCVSESEYFDAECATPSARPRRGALVGTTYPGACITYPLVTTVHPCTRQVSSVAYIRGRVSSPGTLVATAKGHRGTRPVGSGSLRMKMCVHLDIADPTDGITFSTSTCRLLPQSNAPLELSSEPLPFDREVVVRVAVSVRGDGALHATRIGYRFRPAN